VGYIPVDIAYQVESNINRGLDRKVKEFIF
jgi:hypothetical protein